MTRSWTKEEVAFLEGNYPSAGGNFCATALNRSLKSIRRKAETLGVRAPGAKLKSHEQYESELFELESDCYPLEQYVTNKTPILHVCSKGHEWRAKPNHILAGRGCPSCATHGFDVNRPGRCYYIKIEFENLTYYKVGITNATVKDRFRRDSDKRITILKEWVFDHGQDAKDLEKVILASKDRVVVDNFLSSGGNTELFEYDILGLE